MIRARPSRISSDNSATRDLSAVLRCSLFRPSARDQTEVWLDRLVQDFRYGVRTLAKNPGFTLVAMATLAFGIGANTAMFNLLDQVVLRLLPVRDPEQLVIVRETGDHYGNTYGANTISWPMFEDLRDNNQVFSGMFCRFPATVTIGYGDRAAQIPAELVSGAYFPDPLTFVGSAIVLTVAAGLAGLIPALRASSLAATTALRHE
jgi:ABC-type antimicrobial peptide transport system permease subunit